MYDAFVWNWSKNAICDDVIFNAYCINDAIGNEVQWFTTEKQVVLGMNSLEFQSYIVFIDGMFIKIHKLWNDGADKIWFNGH
jgi:hypothetical protein